MQSRTNFLPLHNRIIIRGLLPAIPQDSTSKNLQLASRELLKESKIVVLQVLHPHNILLVRAIKRSKVSKS